MFVTIRIPICIQASQFSLGERQTDKGFGGGNFILLLDST